MLTNVKILTIEINPTIVGISSTIISVYFNISMINAMLKKGLINFGSGLHICINFCFG